jgi:hypothetical protein
MPDYKLLDVDILAFVVIPLVLVAALAWGVAFASLALVSRAAPARVNATMMGLTFMSLFVSNNIIGWIGGLCERMSPIEFCIMHAAVGASRPELLLKPLDGQLVQFQELFALGVRRTLGARWVDFWSCCSGGVSNRALKPSRNPTLQPGLTEAQTAPS